MRDRVMPGDEIEHPEAVCHGHLRYGDDTYGRRRWRCQNHVRVVREGQGWCGTHDPEGKVVKREPKEFEDPLADLPEMEKCPFCKRTAVLIRDIQERRGYWRVGCVYEKCPVVVYVKSAMSSPLYAIQRWNRRDGKGGWHK